jgi:hypothetical protein
LFRFRYHIDTRHSVGLPWTSDQSHAQTSTCTTYNTHKRQVLNAPAGFEPPNPSKRAAADPRLRPRGHWDRSIMMMMMIIIIIIIIIIISQTLAGRAILLLRYMNSRGLSDVHGPQVWNPCYRI